MISSKKTLLLIERRSYSNELISYLNENRNKRAISLLLFIDFRKAFDLVDSEKLLRKLFHYGFDNSAIEMLKNYFKDRHQSVKYDKKLSPLMDILLGVPQGKCLRSTLLSANDK